MFIKFIITCDNIQFTNMIYNSNLSYDGKLFNKSCSTCQKNNINCISEIKYYLNFTHPLLVEQSSSCTPWYGKRKAADLRGNARVIMKLYRPAERGQQSTEQ